MKHHFSCLIIILGIVLGYCFFLVGTLLSDDLMVCLLSYIIAKQFLAHVYFCIAITDPNWLWGGTTPILALVAGFQELTSTLNKYVA
jgi:hypothetical protein